MILEWLEASDGPWREEKIDMSELCLPPALGHAHEPHHFLNYVHLWWWCFFF